MDYLKDVEIGNLLRDDEQVRDARISMIQVRYEGDIDTDPAERISR